MSSSWINKKRRVAIYTRDGFRCAYCGNEVQQQVGRLFPGKEKMATLDHIVPRSQGGQHTDDNLVCSCMVCNSKRKDTPLFEYLEGDMSKIKTVLERTGVEI